MFELPAGYNEILTDIQPGEPFYIGGLKARYCTFHCVRGETIPKHNLHFWDGTRWAPGVNWGLKMYIDCYIVSKKCKTFGFGGWTWAYEEQELMDYFGPLIFREIKRGIDHNGTAVVNRHGSLFRITKNNVPEVHQLNPSYSKGTEKCLIHTKSKTKRENWLRWHNVQSQWD